MEARCSLFTNHKYLGVYFELIKDICKDDPEQEILTVYVEFNKIKSKDFISDSEDTQIKFPCPNFLFNCL